VLGWALERFRAFVSCDNDTHLLVKLDVILAYRREDGMLCVEKCIVLSSYNATDGTIGYQI
jgi:hypothetical protein